jgi:hypothetical protein
LQEPELSAAEFPSDTRATASTQAAAGTLPKKVLLGAIAAAV